MAFEATVRQLEILGEVAAHLPEHIQSQAPAIPRENVIGIRKRLIHGYFSVDPDIVWNVVHEKLPTMLPILAKLLREQP